MGQRHVCGIAAPRYEDTTDPWLIVSRVKGEPSAGEKDFKPRVEIHRGRVWGNADIAEIAIAIAGGNVEATAQRNCQMGEIAAHADTLAQSFVCGARRPRFGVAKPKAPMNEITDGLNSCPSANDAAKVRPGKA